jgi:hypothetical protein
MVNLRTVLKSYCVPLNEWTYPSGFKGPAPAPNGLKLVVEYYDFMGIEKRWKYVVEPQPTHQEED